jgi:peptidoglycan/xylan/chitin deacetylase (PgdA/CDA1 family)
VVAKLRRLLHLAAAAGLYYTGVLRLWCIWRWRVQGKREVCILGLHRVLNDEEFSRSHTQVGIIMRAPTFARMLAYLSRQFQVVALGDLLDGSTSAAATSKPLCLLTFDDGWRDNHSTAFPLLRKYRMPATIFLVTGLVENQGMFWVERLRQAWEDPVGREQICARVVGGTIRDASSMPFDQVVESLKRRPVEERDRILAQFALPLETPESGDGVDRMMRWDEAKELCTQGIEFGAHTVNHPLLTYESDATVERELTQGKQMVEARLGVQVRAFAYPNGDWDERIRAWVQRTGYECAFTTQPGWYRPGADPFTIRRILVHERNVTGWDGEFSPAVFNLTLARARK